MSLDNDEFFEVFNRKGRVVERIDHWAFKSSMDYPRSRSELVPVTNKSTCWIGTPGCPGVPTGSPITHKHCICQSQAIKAKEVLSLPAHLLDDYELELAIKQLKPKPEPNDEIGVYDLI